MGRGDNCVTSTEKSEVVEVCVSYCAKLMKVWSIVNDVMEFWAGLQVFLVSRRTMEPGVADGRVTGIIWELTAHSAMGLIRGNSPYGVEGEERGVATIDDVLGVAGREGVRGRERRGEGEEEVRRGGGGSGRGGGGGGFVRASISDPCRGKDRGGQARMGTWREGGSEGEMGNVARRTFPGGQGEDEEF